MDIHNMFCKVWDKTEKKFVMGLGSMKLALDECMVYNNLGELTIKETEEYKVVFGTRYFDRNGEQIYIGDILGTKDGHICKVVYRKDGVGIVWSKKFADFWDKKIKFSECTKLGHSLECKLYNPWL